MREQKSDRPLFSRRSDRIILLAELDRLSLPFEERLALSRAMYILLQPGDCVFKWNCDNQFGVVVEKFLGKGKIAQVWVDWGDRVPMIEQPFLLEIF